MAGQRGVIAKSKNKTTPARAKKKVQKNASTSRHAASRSRKKAIETAPSRLPISPQRKDEIAGVALITLGILLLLTLLTSYSGSLTENLARILTSAMGWGAYLLPIIVLLLGSWFLLSQRERFPAVSGERLIGIVLFFFNLLTWFQLFSASLNPSQAGGGFIGQAIYNALVQGFGKPGAFILVIAWSLLALILLVHLSISDLTGWLAEKMKDSQSVLAQYLRDRNAERKLKHVQTQLSPAENNAEPQGFPQPAPNVNATTQTAPQSNPQPAQADQPWVLPVPEEILDPVETAPLDEDSDLDRARVIEETLRSFSTPAHVVEIRRGPAITLFGVEPDFIETRSGKTRVRVSNIARLADDLAMALKASRIRIQAPVPGKGFVGIEVPNQKISLVSMLEVVESPSFLNSKAPLRFGLGKDVSGQPFTADLAAMPHLLIAGTTGSGKSVCVNAILAEYLLTLTPDQLRIVLVDPKRVELTGYNGIPHLLAPVIVEAEKVVGALQWMMREMDSRYRTFAEAGVRNIDEYNQQIALNGGKVLPYLLVVIDELADLMMLAPDETERNLTRLAQLARATGIHLILATQRPSADILTGLIKANFPARIAFAVASNVDSRVILDQPGAERLLGRGDMLFQAPDAAAPVRLQGTYVSDSEINRLTDFWRLQAMKKNPSEKPETYLMSPEPQLPLNQEPLWQELQKDPDEDPITSEAIALIRKEGRASVSMLQRKMRIGYTRAARLIEKLEDEGIVGPPNAQTGTREVLDYGKYGPLNED